jgi:hypothetical protein
MSGVQRAAPNGGAAGPAPGKNAPARIKQGTAQPQLRLLRMSRGLVLRVPTVTRHLSMLEELYGAAATKYKRAVLGSWAL